MRHLKLLLLALPLMASCGEGGSPAAGDGVSVVVGFNGPVDAALFLKHGGTVTLRNDSLSFVAGTMPLDQIPLLQSELSVQYVEEDGVASTTAVAFPQIQPWGIYHIATNYAWTAHGGVNGSDGAYGAAHTRQNHDTTPGVTRVRVAILDTGIQLDHPDLVGQAIFGATFATGGDSDVQGHGTHVAGTVAARDNAEGVVGVAPCAQVVAVKVLSNSGTGAHSWIASGMSWAADNNCRVINMSLSGTIGSTTLSNAVLDAWSKNVVICAAAGNDGEEPAPLPTVPHYPAAYTNCISVVATTEADVKATFSSYGSTTDLSAPGNMIPSTYKGNDYVYMSGTSQATPHVAGVAALVWAKVLQQADGTIKTNTYVRGRLETYSAGPIDGGAIPKLVDPWYALLNVPQ